MTAERAQRGRPYALAVLVAGGLALGVGFAAAGNPNERDVKPQANVLDKDDITQPDSKIWALDFRFKDPRILTMDVPGRHGRRVCLYLWYQVINKTKEPRTFIPDFDLVSLDQDVVYHDEVLPRVQQAVREIEDPTDYLRIRNSVTIYTEPIPPSKPEATPRAVTGVALWDITGDGTGTEANRFSQFNIFVSGLSNGWSVTDAIPPDTEPVVRRKTLKLKFKRVGDHIEFVEPAEWIYRGSHMKVPGGLPGAPKEEKKEEKKDDKPAPKPGG
jgi:hypothetical protein